MEEILRSLADQIPSLVAFIIFVLAGIKMMNKSLDEKDNRFIKELKDQRNAFTETLSKRDADHERREREAWSVIERNTIVFTKVQEILKNIETQQNKGK